jgi:hypothetical protein
MLFRFDFILSYWIFAWYILYITKFVSYSPKLIIIFGIIENAITLIIMLLHGSNSKTILYFVIINIVIKGIPFYTVRNDTIRSKDIFATICVILIYLLWVKINGQSVIQYYKKIIYSLIHNKRDTIGIYILTQIEKYINKITNLKQIV